MGIVGTRSNSRSNKLFFLLIDFVFFDVGHMSLKCHSTVYHLQLHFVKSVVWAWIGSAHLRCQRCGLNLGAEGQTVRLRGPRSFFTQSFMLNLVLTITQKMWFFEVRYLNDMSLKCPSCVLQIVFNSWQHSAFEFNMPEL